MLRFGTDGIRGVAGEELSSEFTLTLGRAIGEVDGASTYLIGRDTRQSGPMLTEALAAGLNSSGVDVVDLGVITTPGLAYLAQERGIPAAMISASHNPYADNGIKLFSADGTKLSPEMEQAIEERLESLLARRQARAESGPIGSSSEDHHSWESYAAHLTGLVSLNADRRLKVVCDCANGAASYIAPEVLSRLGVDLEVINASPNGTNINAACGSTHPEALIAAVLASTADVGLAFDGDADRLIAVDERGGLVDGDVLLVLFASSLAQRGALDGDAIAVTVMSNLGLHRALSAAEIDVVQTAVGDKFVVEAMRERGLVLGGEQSGHIVFGADASTGDGILTALRLLEVLSYADVPLSELSERAMTRFPQVLSAVAVLDRNELDTADELWGQIRAVESRLGDRGRVLIRASGTEEIVRVMVEADDSELARQIHDELVELVRTHLGVQSNA